MSIAFDMVRKDIFVNQDAYKVKQEWNIGETNTWNVTFVVVVIRTISMCIMDRVLEPKIFLEGDVFFLIRKGTIVLRSNQTIQFAASGPQRKRNRNACPKRVVNA